MPLALYALTAGAFGIGVTEFVIMGLLLEVSADLGVSISAAGLLISGYALGVVVGAPLLGAIAGRWSRKTLLMSLMVVFTVGNLACALAPDYWSLMADGDNFSLRPAAEKLFSSAARTKTCISPARLSMMPSFLQTPRRRRL